MRNRQIAYQVAALAAVAFAIAFLVSNTLANLEARRIASGFGFLGREAGFEIGESFFLRYGASDTYLRALAVGLVNTLMVSAIGIVLATLLVHVINRRSFGWTMDFVLAPGALAMGLALAVVAALLAGIYPALRTARIGLGGALREE